jgi:hypothetical protein
MWTCHGIVSHRDRVIGMPRRSISLQLPPKAGLRLASRLDRLS